MNNRFLSDYIVLFINSQNDLLEQILEHKSYEKINLLKTITKVITKTIASTYNVLDNVNGFEKTNEDKIEELENLRKNILKNGEIKIYDCELRKQINKNLHYVETLESIMLHILPDIDDSNYVLVSKMIVLFEILDNLFE